MMETESQQTDVLLTQISKQDSKIKETGKVKRDFSSNNRIRQSGLELNFQHVSLNIKDTQILQDVSGLARPGEILAIMGPSGSGKTSLLNVLGGRICGNCHATIGGQTLNKRTRRKISYVLQEDIFFANLTLHDTLMFASELRLPEDLPHHSKQEIVNDIVTQLEIKKSMNTIIGDSMVRGLSGGEKKRANIANELLTDPAVLLLDEPTSGLDSTTAFELALALKRYAVNNKKTVVMTVHQPSSQMFFLFNKVILLCKGQMMYHGTPDNVLNYFGRLGQTCTIPHYNPADFILDMAKSDDNVLDSLIDSCSEARKNMEDCPILLHSLQRKTNGYAVVNEEEKQMEMLMDSRNENIATNAKHMPRIDETTEELLKLPGVHRDGVYSSERNGLLEIVDISESRWTTSFLKQLTVLTHRSVVQGRKRYTDKLTYIKTFGIALICGLVWFQIGRGHPLDTAVPDIGSVLFFMTLFNSFNPLFEVLTCFPSEKVVINKERMAGSYRLSAYYLAKTISELPILFTNPTIFLIFVYWMAGLNGFNNFVAFLGTWLVFITTGIACQSIGIFASAATMDFQKGIVVGILIMITFILLGGFYVKNIPPWLNWLRYCSPITHAWSLLLYLEFDSDERIVCSEAETSLFSSCMKSLNSSTSVGINGTDFEQLFVEHKDILAYNLADIPTSICVVALMSITILFRILGYFCLRFFHKPASK